MSYNNIQILEKLQYDPSNRSKILQNHTDKIILPERILKKLVDTQKNEGFKSLPHPLIFRLSTPSHNTYVGVKEFHDEDEDSVFLSTDVCNRLNIPVPINLNDMEIDEKSERDDFNVSPLILSLELALNVSGFVNNITKATIELSPRKNYRVQDWKAFLEATLSNKYTAITTNDVLTFEIENQEYILDVVNVKTSENIRTVCVVDRDIELKIKNNDNAEIIENGNDKKSFDFEYTDLFGDKKGDIKIDERVKLSIQPNEKIVCDGEFLIAFDQFVNRDRFEFGSMNKPTKEWFNKTDDQISIFVYGLGKEIDGIIQDLKFDIILNVDKENNDKEKEDEDVIDEDSIRCVYCKNIIKKSSQFLHENFCSRNNVLCPLGCGEIFLKKIPKTHWHCCSTYGNDEFSHQIHNEYNHNCELEEITCDSCNEYHCLNKYILANHKSKECPKELHECKYCHLILPRGEPSKESKFYGISSHEWLCGSKTTECPKCNKIIKLRELEIHMKIHEFDRLNKEIPIKCSNILCVNIINMEEYNNNIGLCKDCFGSLYSNIIDPDGKRLLQRIERKYILQIKNGCGDKINCMNELCNSCSKCRISEKSRESMSEIVKIVKNDLMTNIQTNEGKFQFEFCVSKNMNERRRFVSMFEGSDWALGWICKSNEINGNNIDKMNQWLENNAVSNQEYKK